LNITACLLSWRRKYHLPEICHHLLSVPEIGDVLVWQNESDGVLECLPDGVRVIHCPSNQYVYGRFLASLDASTDAVFFQDDDLLVKNIPGLSRRYVELGGETIVANLAQDRSSRHWSLWQSKRPPWIELGFGSIVPVKAVHILREWPYDRELLKRKADKIVTVLNPWEAVRAGEAEITRLFYKGKESGRDANSLWLRSDHKPLNNEVIPLTLKWKSQIEESRT
jgi:hypothetical protein